MTNEHVFRIGIKKTELPYIKKRIEDFGMSEYYSESLLTEFNNYLDKYDDEGLGDMMSDAYLEEYKRIRDELLAKRRNTLCPFCSEAVVNLKVHLQREHKEEIVKILDVLTKKDVRHARREIIIENL